MPALFGNYKGVRVTQTSSKADEADTAQKQDGLNDPQQSEQANGRKQAQVKNAARVSREGLPDGWSFVNQLVASSSLNTLVNLGQGSFGFPPPRFVTDAAKVALDYNETNQYSPTVGRLRLRQAIATAYEPLLGKKIDPLNEVVVTTGANEGILSAFMAFIDPGDEVLLFEPFYDQFIWGIRMAGGVVKYVPMKAPARNDVSVRSAGEWEVDLGELQKALSPRTKMLVLNSPHNPTGKVFSHHEVSTIGAFCVQNNIIILSDEVYDRVPYVPFVRPAHISPAVANLTLTTGSAGKSFFVTGWRVGWLIGPQHLIKWVTQAHMQICYSTVSPLQEAVAVGLEQADDFNFFAQSKSEMEKRVHRFTPVWRELDLQYFNPEGGYYIVVNLEKIQIPPEHYVPAGYGQVSHDFSLAWFLVKAIGVAAIPCSIFYTPENAHLAANLVRFSVAKADEDLDEAICRLRKLKMYMKK